MVVKDNLWEYTPPPPSKLYGCVQGKSLSCGVRSTLRKRNPNQTRKKTGSYRRHRRMEWNIIFDTFFIGTIIIHHKNESEFFFSKLWLMRLLFYFWWICFHSRFEILLNVRSYCWNLMLLRWSCNVKSRLIAATICKFTCLNLNTSKRKPSL